MKRKQPTLQMLDAADQALIKEIYTRGPQPLTKYKGRVIMNPLNRLVTIGWPEGAVVDKGFSQSTPVVSLTLEGRKLFEDKERSNDQKI
jgi:hypothetical protein